MAFHRTRPGNTEDGIHALQGELGVVDCWATLIHGLAEVRTNWHSIGRMKEASAGRVGPDRLGDVTVGDGQSNHTEPPETWPEYSSDSNTVQPLCAD